MKYISLIILIFLFPYILKSQNFLEDQHKYKYVDYCDTSVLKIIDVGHYHYLFPKPNSFEQGNYFVKRCNTSIPEMFFSIGENKLLKDYIIWFDLDKHYKIIGFSFFIVEENKNRAYLEYHIYEHYYFPFGQTKFLKRLNKLYKKYK